MKQFDVYVNPIEAARRAYPFVIALQSDFVPDARQQIVAPLVARHELPAIAGRLIPIVAIDGKEHVVLIPALTGVRSRDLSVPHCSASTWRSELLAAIDYLFFGV